jgi:hypothetical protein
MAAVARDPARRPTAEQLANMLAAVEQVPIIPSVTATRFGVGPVVLPPVAAPVTLSSGPVPGGAPGWTRNQKLAVAAIALLALLLIIWRVRDPDSATGRNEPNAAVEDSEDSREPEDDEPMVYDQYGNPVDEETRRQVLDEMNSRGRGRGKKRR